MKYSGLALLEEMQQVDHADPRHFARALTELAAKLHTEKPGQFGASAEAIRKRMARILARSRSYEGRWNAHGPEVSAPA